MDTGPTGVCARPTLTCARPTLTCTRNSLLNPTAIRPVWPAYLVFADDTGLWQLHTPSGGVSSIMQASHPPPSLNYTASRDGSTLTVLYTGNASLTITALGSHCPAQTTSAPGSDCAQACGLDDYVDPATGACLPCGSSSDCQPGNQSMPCTNSTPALCTPCPPLSAQLVYTSTAPPGQCHLATVAWLPPCPLNYYLGSQYCLGCPTYATTLLTGATNIQQCRCPADFQVRSPLAGNQQGSR